MYLYKQNRQNKIKGSDTIPKQTFKTITKTVDGKKEEEVIIKKTGHKYLAVILKQNKSFTLKWVSYEFNSFRHGRNTYFTIPDGMYLNENKVLVGIYLEGVSTPLSHKNVKKEKVTREITKEDGTKETVKVEMIKGLKYDSEIIDILLNRGLAEKFTTVKPDRVIFILIVMLIINILIGLVAVGVEFV